MLNLLLYLCMTVILNEQENKKLQRKPNYNKFINNVNPDRCRGSIHTPKGIRRRL